MNRVTFAFDMPHGAAYVGGIAFIINQYILNKELFYQNGYQIELLDYSKCNIIDKRVSSKVLNVLNMVKQARMLDNYILENPDTIIHLHTSIGWTLLKDLIIANYVKRRHKVNLVLSIHFAELSKILAHNSIVRRFQIRSLKTSFERIIFLSEKTRDEFVRCGIEKKKTEVLYTFHSYHSNNTFTPQRSNIKTLLFMGTIDKRKGIIDLLKALRQINNYAFHLHICGQINDDTIKDEFLGLLEELNEKVTFHGYVNGLEKEELFENADIFVLPSYGEGMPIVIMEAMAKGCAIISTEVGAIGEIVKKENGILIQPGDIDALKEALKYFMDDKMILETVKEKNTEYGSEFNIESNIEKLTDIYMKVR